MPFYVPPASGVPSLWSKPLVLKALGRRRRIYCALLLFLGLSTFFAPSIATDTPVLGHSHWSPLDILNQINAGNLPAAPLEYGSGYNTMQVKFHFWSAYLLLLVALLAVEYFPSRKLLLSAAMIGCYFSLGLAGRGSPSLQVRLERLFYGESGRFYMYGQTNFRTHPTQHMLLLLAINALFIGILLTDALDGNSAAEPGGDAVLSEDLDAIIAANPKPDTPPPSE